MPPTPSDKSTAFPDQSIQDAYRGADYRVNGFLLRIDVAHPGFDTFLEGQGVEYYVVLTADNPRSVRLAPPVNQARRDTLLQLLKVRGSRYVAATGEDPQGRWPVEEGVCLLDPSPEDARELGRLYEQHAIVEGRRGGCPTLHWL
jgi:hypothetical protein